MKIFFTTFSASPYLELPQDIIGWAGWLVLLGMVAIILWHWRSYNKPWGKKQIWFLIILLAAIPITNLFIGFTLPSGAALPPPKIPENPSEPIVLIFSAIPWLLAAGLLGPAPAAGLAFLSGLLRVLWNSHNLFFPLEMALLAALFSLAINQRYRTKVFQLLRHPIVVALLLTVLYPLISMLESLLTEQGVFVNRLDYALTHLTGATMAIGIELLIAGLFAEILAIVFSPSWGGKGQLVPSPSERSMQTRFLYSMAPIALILLLILMAGDWFVAGKAARDMLQARMENATQMAADSVPSLLETGQNLISQLANNSELYTSKPNEVTKILAEASRNVPYFRQIYLLDKTGNSVTGYPLEYYVSNQAPLEEQKAIQIALSGVPVQMYTIPPAPGGTTAQLTFIAGLKDSSGSVHGVLIGHSDFETNPFTKPIMTSLGNLSKEGGQGMLLDEDGNILYHPDINQVMTTYSGSRPEGPPFFDDTAPDGTRRLVSYQEVVGYPWSAVITVPARVSQQLALKIAAPLLGIILLLSVLAVILFLIAIRAVTSSLQNLSLEAGRISQGQLDHPLRVDGEDEIGRLRRSFEQMRVSLKARLDELNRLLIVSQGVASSLEVSEAVQPVLESALVTGACAARVVLAPTIVPDIDGDTPSTLSFGQGPAKELYSDLDEQILNLTRQQERLVLTNPSRPRMLSFLPGSPRPEAILAMSLRHENQYYGTLWVAYDRHHTFSDEEINFMATLAGQAALAAANARLFLNAEIGRQRLAAILASTPDPVLVTDQRDRLLLANPAAWQVLELGMDTDEGQPIESIISQKDLVNLLRSSAVEKQSVEVTLVDDRVYLATASSVLAEGQRVGRICVLRDITHFKELDALKSEFVSTVSHDLRSPLTLMRGYATMLEMVGELNEQQTGYVRKIVIGVESMSRLVNNLLDLGRIEAGIDLQLEMVPVHDVIERVVSALQLQANQKHIQINVDIPKQTIPLIEADQPLLQQALQNLVENAIKYTHADGKVTVGVRARQERMVFEISDTGIGVSPMDQPRLFEKFYRGAQHGSKEQRGTGLGLAIVKSIADRHGGQVWVESQLGKGSTFYLAIPLRQPKRMPVKH